MLDAFIIEELRRREEQERDRARREQPRLELPLDDHHVPRNSPRRDDEDAERTERGVIVIDL